MPSQLEIAIAQHRAAVLAEEDKAIGVLIAAYDPARVELLRRIEALVKHLLDHPLTPSQVARWERATELFAQIDAEITRLAALTNRVVLETQGQMVAMADEHTKALAILTAVNRSPLVAEIKTGWNQLTPSNVEALLGRMADGSPLNATLAKYGPEASEAIKQALIKAVTLNTNPRGTAAILKRIIEGNPTPGQARSGGVMWKLLRLARTETLQSYRSATLQGYRDNADLGIVGWRWVSAHQARTCLACLALDGHVFPLSVEFQPTHPSCRCSSVVVFRGEAGSELMTGSEWFYGQPEATQRQMVPVTAWEDFSDGHLTLSDFVQLDHNEQWGDSYREASVQDARANAAMRRQNERKAA